MPKKKKSVNVAPNAIDAKRDYTVTMNGAAYFTIIRFMEEGILPGLTAKQVNEVVNPILGTIRNQLIEQSKE